jgi:hypothetical protein
MITTTVEPSRWTSWRSPAADISDAATSLTTTCRASQHGLHLTCRPLAALETRGLSPSASVAVSVMGKSALAIVRSLLSATLAEHESGV